MNKALDTSKGQNGLRNYAILMIGLLVIQYVLGMVTNLFMQFPDPSQADQVWAAARSQFPSAAHMVIGTLLLVSAVIFVINAARKNNRPWIVSSVVGLIGIVVAFYGGVMFTSSQVNVYSLIMALAFFVAFLAYGWGLFAARG